MYEGLMIAVGIALAGSVVVALRGLERTFQLRLQPAFPARPARLFVATSGDVFQTNQPAEAAAHCEFDAATECEPEAELKALNQELEAINDDLRRLKDALIQAHPTSSQLGRYVPEHAGTTSRMNQLINQFLEHTNWSEWERDQNEPITRAPKMPNVYELFDQEIMERHGRSPQPDPAVLGMVKFTQDGECITLPTHTRLAAVAYELEQLYIRDTAQHPLEDAS